MNGISADWSVLLETATRLIQNGQILDELVGTINSDVSGASQVWQGAASQAYQEQWSSLLPQFKQAAENIVIMGSQITNYVTAQQEIEQQAQMSYQRQ